jgi:hypothetical protein
VAGGGFGGAGCGVGGCKGGGLRGWGWRARGEGVGAGGRPCLIIHVDDGLRVRDGPHVRRQHGDDEAVRPYLRPGRRVVAYRGHPVGVGRLALEEERRADDARDGHVDAAEHDELGGSGSEGSAGGWGAGRTVGPGECERGRLLLLSPG